MEGAGLYSCSGEYKVCKYHAHTHTRNINISILATEGRIGRAWMRKSDTGLLG